MAKIQFDKVEVRKSTRKRPGVHSKTKNSKLKTSRNYSKRYRGQGHA